MPDGRDDHHGELKVFAHTTTGIMNASVEFDVETLAPQVPHNHRTARTSNALAIAERLGLPADVVEAPAAPSNPSAPTPKACSPRSSANVPPLRTPVAPSW